LSGSNEIILTVTHIAHGGESIGRWEGKVVFVPFTIPGERVRVRIVEEKSRYARAELLEVLEPSDDRTEAPCPSFGLCGGCQWQHITYERQLRLRLEVIEDQMRRLAHIEDLPLEGIVPAEHAWHYRNNIQLHPAPRTEGMTPLGFVSVDRRTVLPIEECLIAHPLVDELHASLELAWEDLQRLTLRAGVNTGDRLALLETRGTDGPEISLDLPVSFVHMTNHGHLQTLIGNAFFYECLGGHRFRVSAPSFFQVHTEQAANLVEVVQEFCALGGSERVLDLYCGIGTFSLAIGDAAEEVVGIESSPWAVADASVNGTELANFTVLEGDALEVLTQLEGSFQIVIVDPPRRGCGADVVAQLLRLQPVRVVYVSCDPATLARDTGYLLEGGFELQDLIAVDMFPQTAHVETVALFTR